MSGSRMKTAALFTVSLLVLSLFVLYQPRTAFAEPMFLLKSDKIKKTTEHTSKSPTLGFDDKGNLTVRNGNLSVVLIYNPPSSENEALSNKSPVLMAMNHENPEITGFGVKINIAF